MKNGSGIFFTFVPMQSQEEKIKRDVMLTNINAALLLLEQSHWKCSAQLPSLHVGCSNLSNILSHRVQTCTEQQQGTSGSEVLSHNQPDYFH